MITLDKYIKQPTKALSTSFIKNNTRALLKTEKRVLDEDFNEDEYSAYTDTRVVRLVHRLNKLSSTKLPRGVIFQTFVNGEVLTLDRGERGIPFDNILLNDDLRYLLTEIFNAPDEIYSEILTVIKDKRYRKEFLFILYNEKSNKAFENKRKYYPIGLCFGTFNKEIREAEIEMVGVLDDYKNSTYMNILLEEFLLRVANNDGLFVTTNIEETQKEKESGFDKLAAYHECGFGEDCVWHFLKMK